MARSREVVLAELEQLKQIQPLIPEFSAFGDDNAAAVAAQIEVLQQDLSDRAIYGHSDWSEHAISAAQDARMWMDGDEDSSPSESWSHLVPKKS